MAQVLNGTPQGEVRTAVTYSEGTVEWNLKHKPLPRPVPRVQQQDAHFKVRRKPRDAWHNAIGAVITSRKQLQIGPQFHYSKLGTGEIRILSVQPGKDDEPLKATLFKRKLEDVRDRYEALSYTWGNPKEKPLDKIMIRDLDAELPQAVSMKTVVQTAVFKGWGAPFYIRSNLNRALMRLRKTTDSPINIWVDAICIDQSESGHREKEQQLAMMAQIYNYASHVCIWLGDGIAQAEGAFSLVRDIMNFKNFDTKVRSAETKEKWIQLIEIMKVAWFSRRWIIQEVALSKSASLHCAAQVVHWDDFADAVSLLLEKIHILRSKFDDEIFEDVETTSASVLIQCLDNICHKSSTGDVLAKLLDLETLVSTLLGFQATSPRDTIYSVLSLANDPPGEDEPWIEMHSAQLESNWRNDHHEIPLSQDQLRELKRKISLKPNYTISTRDVFIAFVTRSISKSKSLDIICRHWAPNVTDDEFSEKVPMPSWISNIYNAPFGGPDSSKGRQNGDNFVAYLPHDRRKRYRACGSYLADDFSMALDPFLQSAEGPSLRKNMSRNRAHSLRTQFSPFPFSSPRPISVLSPVENRSYLQVNTANSLSTPPSPTAVEPSSFSEANKVGVAPAVTVSDPAGGTTGISPAIRVEIPRSPRVSISENMKSRRSSIRAVSSDVERKYQLSGVIKVGGLMLGKIRYQSDVMRGGIIPGEWVTRLGWRAADKQNVVPDTLWRLLVADRAAGGGKPPSWYQRACLHGLVDPRVSDNEGNIHSVTPPNRKISEMTTEYFHRVETVVWNRRLFEAEANVSRLSNVQVRTPETKQAMIIFCKDIRLGSASGPKSLFGLAPKEAEDGDLVCILFGCTVPVILRPIEDLGLYKLIGEAYVHGVMDGEAVISSEVVDAMKVDFQIC
ncbi:heterokaryon incompatibility domain-containing protein [Trichoderma sp. TUCIM 5745]